MTVATFKPSYLGIEPHELVHFLLREAGQYERDAVNPADVLSVLGLSYLSFDFATSLIGEELSSGRELRALLSFPERLVATDSGLYPPRERFSVLHEVAHYILPNHHYMLYLCDEEGLGNSPRLVLEKEANDFAAELLFMGDRFSLEANSHPISAATIKVLAQKHLASFEATARRLVERNVHKCMLVVFSKRKESSRINIDVSPTWEVRYCVPSASFKASCFTSVEGCVDPGIAVSLSDTTRDIADSIIREISIISRREVSLDFKAEFFSNGYSIFCLLTPTGNTATER